MCTDMRQGGDYEALLGPTGLAVCVYPRVLVYTAMQLFLAEWSSGVPDQRGLVLCR